MKSFKDGAGRTWDVEIDAWLIKQVAARTGVQLARLLDDNWALWGELVKDPVKFVDVLFVLVGDRAEKLGVSEEQFFRGLSGDPLEAAYEAFRGAFADFSPRHLRAILNAASDKAKVATERATEKALRTLERETQKSLAKIETWEPDATSSNSVTEPPVSPGSAPAG